MYTAVHTDALWAVEGCTTRGQSLAEQCVVLCLTS